MNDAIELMSKHAGVKRALFETEIRPVDDMSNPR
jgi:hypothetical protein